ncbi:MAG: aminopeptidase P family protein [Bauldia sp.]|nr:aminopeptidase P family protein [Bauldia sp.]
MFQIFDVRGDRAASAGRIAALRDRLNEENLDGFVVPHADEHQSEYLPPSAERLAWLTGFTGSAGSAIVLHDEAAVFVDGRYTLQATAEVDPAAASVVAVAETPPGKWLSARLRPGDRVGYDPWLFTLAEARKLGKRCADVGASLVPVTANPIDAIWTRRPAAPLGPVELHPQGLAGEGIPDKLRRIATRLGEKKADALLLAHADAIAWTFNIRGSDVAHNAAPLAFAIIRREGRPQLFIDARKLSNAVRSALADVADIAEPSVLLAAIEAVAGSKRRVLADPEGIPAALGDRVTMAGGVLVEGEDPTALLKARKNTAEIDGARRAHLRDGLALVRFLAWLDRESPRGEVDEIGAIEALERFRIAAAHDDGSALVDISFDTIAGSGPNGAIIHYRVNRATNRKLDQDSLFLIDSGGQYRDGTTDVTRTVAIGTPTAEMRDRFTRVLRGHIGVARARFPAGTSGAQIDVLARIPQWEAGLDYDHGTGHGVGSFLSVHEGPQRLSKTGHVALEPGMILSNEPGSYRTGAYGIRIENLMVVTPAAAIPGGERPMLGFETLTLAPIDLRLVDAAQMTRPERDWLNSYHARVRAAHAKRLSPEDRAWLEDATRAI